jgi:hypothetical protein
MAELKERHGLRRAQGGGRTAVLIPGLGAAIAHDIKKLARWHRRQPRETALVCVQVGDDGSHWVWLAV